MERRPFHKTPQTTLLASSCQALAARRRQACSPALGRDSSTVCDSQAGPEVSPWQTEQPCRTPAGGWDGLSALPTGSRGVKGEGRRSCGSSTRCHPRGRLLHLLCDPLLVSSVDSSEQQGIMRALCFFVESYHRGTEWECSLTSSISSRSLRGSRATVPVLPLCPQRAGVYAVFT